MSNRLSGIQPPDGPPVWTALNRRPSARPPPISKTIWRRVRPIGTSISPVLVTAPVRAKTFVPLERSVPIALSQSPPRLITAGILAKVSTLFINVGQPQRPEAAGYGGRGFGVPLPPCIDAISAVSSPHTKAPAPIRTSTWKSKRVPAIS